MGLAPPRHSRPGLAVCRHLLAEASAACVQRGVSDVTLLPLDPRCDRTWSDWEAVLGSLGPACASCGHLVIIGAGCLPAGRPTPSAPPARIVRHSTCFALLADEAFVEAAFARGCYLVTPGWLRGWRAAVAAWGYDRTTARDHFREFARTVLLLDTGTDPGAISHLQEFAQFLGLDAEAVPVGLDRFGRRIGDAVECPP